MRMCAVFDNQGSLKSWLVTQRPGKAPEKKVSVLLIISHLLIRL